MEDDDKKVILPELENEVSDENRRMPYSNVELFDYLGTIELGAIMLRKGLISLDEFDQQFGYRVRNCWNNRAICEHIQKHYEYYSDFKYAVEQLDRSNKSKTCKSSHVISLLLILLLPFFVDGCNKSEEYTDDLYGVWEYDYTNVAVDGLYIQKNLRSDDCVGEIIDLNPEYLGTWWERKLDVIRSLPRGGSILPYSDEFCTTYLFRDGVLSSYGGSYQNSGTGKYGAKIKFYKKVKKYKSKIKEKTELASGNHIGWWQTKNLLESSTYIVYWSVRFFDDGKCKYGQISNNGSFSNYEYDGVWFDDSVLGKGNYFTCYTYARNGLPYISSGGKTYHLEDGVIYGVNDPPVKTYYKEKY